jgi:phosphate transport system substrate-binding protein
MLVNKNYAEPNKAIAMEAMIEYGLTKGQQQSAALGYVPLPPEVIRKVAAAADQLTPDYTIKVE